MPSANAKLNIGENEFYYSGTTSGSLVEKKSVVKWLVEKLADVVDYVLGVMTMGGRMVFVGWTALAEHVLTWFLETASGVNLNGEDISSTDLTALGDSSKNVTVQAIVYNRVPALNVNFFKFKTTDLFRDGDNYISPTGQILKCNKCRKPVQECCTNLPSSPEDIKLEDNYCNTGGEDGCKCNGNCSGCRTYKAMRQQESTMPMIALIKKAVAIWYNIIAVLSYAIMLVVLIALGIKSAISSFFTLYLISSIIVLYVECELISSGVPTIIITESLGIPRCNLTTPFFVITSKGGCLSTESDLLLLKTKVKNNTRNNTAITNRQPMHPFFSIFSIYLAFSYSVCKVTKLF